MGPVQRWIRCFGWILYNLFLKLSPIRRALLVVIFICLFLGGFNYETDHFAIYLESSFISFWLLLFVLLLELKDKLLARDELEVGRAVQCALLPTDNPCLSGWDIWLFTRPANDVGGDLVDYLFLTENRLAVMLGDVSGKGLGAALLMAKLQATMRAVAFDHDSLADFGTRVNQILCRDGLPGRFTTLIYLEIEPETDTVRLINAGHMPPLIVRSDQSTSLPPVSLPMGVQMEAEYVEQQAVINQGDLVLIYSDGLSEALNDRGEFYGEDRVRLLIEQLRKTTAPEAGQQILDDVKGFTGEERQTDDLSLIVLKRR